MAGGGFGGGFGSPMGRLPLGGMGGSGHGLPQQGYGQLLQRNPLQGGMYGGGTPSMPGNTLMGGGSSNYVQTPTFSGGGMPGMMYGGGTPGFNENFGPAGAPQSGLTAMPQMSAPAPAGAVDPTQLQRLFSAFGR